MADELTHQSTRRRRLRADLDVLGNAYGFAALVSAVAAVILRLDGHTLRGDVTGVTIPLWIIAMEVRRG